MIIQTLRVSRQNLSRIAQNYVPTTRRTFVATTVRPVDLVQDMYLKELKNYKPAPVKASDAEGHVQKFQIPKPPRSPEESDLASDLKAYENQQVEVEGQSSDAGSSPAATNWFEEDDFEDEPPKEHH